MRCSKCVLPSTTPDISFDEHGVCNYCHKAKPVTYRGEEALLEIINRFRGQGKYDAIVTLSGGRDSSYVALKTVRDYKLRVLAFNYRNPFTHPVAAENIRRIKKNLGIEVVQFDLPRDTHRRSMRHNLLAWMRNPSLAMVPMMCVACKNMWKPVLGLAKSYGAAVAFSGSNPYEQNTFKRELLGVDAEASTVAYYTGYIFGVLRGMMKNPRYMAPEVIPATMIGYLYSGPSAPFVRLTGGGLTKISLFQYLPWSEEEILSRVRNEIGWQSPPDSPTTWRFDCKLDDVKNYIYLKLMGVTEKDDFYSRLVRAGHMTRGEALKRVERENRMDLEGAEQLLAGVGISFKELDRVLDQYLETHPR